MDLKGLEKEILDKIEKGRKGFQELENLIKENKLIELDETTINRLSDGAAELMILMHKIRALARNKT